MLKALVYSMTVVYLISHVYVSVMLIYTGIKNLRLCLKEDQGETQRLLSTASSRSTTGTSLAVKE